MFIYNAVLTTLDPEEVRRYAGLQRAENFDETMIIAACEEAIILIEPQGVWQEYDYDAVRQVIFSDGEEFVVGGKNVGKHLAECEKVIVLAVTVGETIENEITAKFADGEYAAAILLDAAATTAVEQVADEMEKVLRRNVEPRGFLMKRRFSPGYGDWPLAEQTNVTRLCHADRIGITLSSSLMLVPRKSVTAIIGLVRRHDGECDNLALSTTGCEFCAKKDCPSRRDKS